MSTEACESVTSMLFCVLIIGYFRLPGQAMRRYRDITVAALFFIRRSETREASPPVPRLNYGFADEAGKGGDALTAELAGCQPPPIARNNAT